VLRATALAMTDIVGVEDFQGLGNDLEPSSTEIAIDLSEGFDLDSHLASIERKYLYEALERAGGVRTAAAKLLGMSFRSFRYRIAKFEGGEVPEDG